MGQVLGDTTEVQEPRSAGLSDPANDEKSGIFAAAGADQDVSRIAVLDNGPNRSSGLGGWLDPRVFERGPSFGDESVVIVV